MLRKQIYAQHLLCLLVILLIVISYGQYALLRPLLPRQTVVPVHFTQDAKAVQVDWPDYGESALGAVGYGVLETHGPQEPLPTASVIKTLTALAVLRQKPLAKDESGPLITIAQEDIDSYNKFVSQDGSVVHIEPGEQLTEYQALEALMLPSANNIAETLARWAFGSVDGYLTFANSYAKTIGMAHTTVTDPSGLAVSTTSTPSDLIILGEAALANPVLAQVVSEPSATIPVEGTIYNVNSLLGQHGIVGIKTGNSDANPGCFLFAAKSTIGSQPVTLLGVIMYAADLGTALNDSLPVLKSAASNFSIVHITTPGERLATYTMPWGSSATARASKTSDLLVWNDSKTTASARLPQLALPAKQGDTVGAISIHNSLLPRTETVPIVLDHAVEAPSIWWRLTHPTDS